MGSVGEKDGRPSAYTDKLLAHGLSFVYGVTIRLICESIPEPEFFYLGPVKPVHMITLTFRSGGEHYSATRPLRRDPITNTKKRSKTKSENRNKKGGPTFVIR